ncbi:MAG: threonine ammonia-lyase IlvA [Ruaniaceae bacterium]|nr:threonine ammonia-lyase IlvA [Ruaniaceae bacterium]
MNTAAIAKAAQKLKPIVRETPLEHSARHSQALQQPVYLKREDIQIGRSYKVRGAYNFISSLTEEQRSRGVVAASAGNHAQGVAFACRRLRTRGTIYLPSSTPRQKRERIADIGGRWIEQVIIGSIFDDTQRAALAHAQEHGGVFVPAFDDAAIVAGQGTVAVEIMQQLTAPIDTIVVPVGGAGLLAGVATWVNERSPLTRIVAVEPAGARSLAAALAAGAPVQLTSVDSFVDGAAVAKVGNIPFEAVKDLPIHLVSVPEGALCTEMLELYQTEGIIAEPAGALATAALKRLPFTPSGPVVCIVSGGNNDVSRYSDILERSLVYEGLRHYFLVTFPQQPGALRHFLDDVLIDGEDIVLFEYAKKTSRESGPALVGIDLPARDHLQGLLERMDASPLVIEKIAPHSEIFRFLL